MLIIEYCYFAVTGLVCPSVSSILSGVRLADEWIGETMEPFKYDLSVILWMLIPMNGVK